MIKLEDYNIVVTPLQQFIYECTVSNKAGGNTHGIIVQSHAPPTPEGVFQLFTAQPKQFFIEVDVVSLEQSPVVGVVVDSPIPSEPVPQETILTPTESPVNVKTE